GHQVGEVVGADAGVHRAGFLHALGDSLGQMADAFFGKGHGLCTPSLVWGLPDSGRRERTTGMSDFGGRSLPAAPIPTTGERVWAVVAHGAIIFGHVFVLGVILPFAIWLIKKDIDAFSAESAWQALKFNIITFLIAVALTIVGFFLCIPWIG